MSVLIARRNTEYTHLTTHTVTGAIASFAAKAPLPLVSCSAAFAPVQAGSGTPSPSNIRAINGWSGLSFTHCGKNIWHSDQVIEDRSFRKTDGVFVSIGTDQTSYLLGGSAAERYINFEVPPGTYTMSASSETFTGIYIDFVDGGTWANGETKTFAAKTLIKAVRCTQAALTPGTYYWQLQIEVGQTATTIDPYNATTYPVTWETEAGTVYGGTFDVVSGVLTATHKIVTITGEEGYTWTYASSVCTTNSPIFVGAYLGTNTRRIYGLCNMLDTNENGQLNPQYLVRDTADTYGASFGVISGYWGAAAATADAFVARLKELNANGTPLTIYYQLATPQTYQLTPQEIKALMGANNITNSANGNTSVTYLDT